MNNYILCKLERNSFYVTLDITLDVGHKVRAKIDTGCSISVLPYSKLGFSKSECDTRKLKEIIANTAYKLGYGVESGGRNNIRPTTLTDKINCSAIKFRNNVTSFSLNGYIMDVDSIHINYDRVSNILIGMDILSKLQIHMGSSLVDDVSVGISKGDYILIACRKDSINDDFINAVERYLGILVNNTNKPVYRKIARAFDFVLRK